MVFPGVLARFTADPEVPGAPGYSSVGGTSSHMTVGAPWGIRCRPILFDAEESVPDEVYAQFAAVLMEADAAGLNVALASRMHLWSPDLFDYPPGTDNEDPKVVAVYADRDPPPRIHGRDGRWNVFWDYQGSGAHQQFASLEGQLHLAGISGPNDERTVIRQILAFALGVGEAPATATGLRRGSPIDGFSPSDLQAMRIMSGCTDPRPETTPAPTPTPTPVPPEPTPTHDATLGSTPT